MYYYPCNSMYYRYKFIKLKSRIREMQLAFSPIIRELPSNENNVEEIAKCLRGIGDNLNRSKQLARKSNFIMQQISALVIYF